MAHIRATRAVRQRLAVYVTAIMPADYVRYNRHGMPQDITATQRHTDQKGVAAGFENEAGHYELVRVEGTRAHYRFTNRQGYTHEAAMPLAT